MRGRVFDEDEEDERPARADRELTLGTGTLLLLFFALVLLCGLCFGVGFSLGERDAAKAAPLAATAGGAQQVTREETKPAPSQAVSAAPIADDLTTTDGAGTAGQPGANPAAKEQAATEQTATGPAASEQAEQLANGAAGRTVQAALPQAAVTTQQTAPAGVPQAALPMAASAGSFLVQVAAVSDPVDAQVLLDALRKRGYAVTVARAATDSLMHVQVGPFATRAEALATRQRLLNDGYNAIVK